MSVLNLPQVTLMAVTSVRVKDALWALKYSCRKIRFQGVKLLTHEVIRDPKVEVVGIPKLDYDGYSRFVIYDLYKYFSTSHVLLIQDDGYVVHPESWTDEFLNYDYIGAPWKKPEDDFSCRDKDGNIRRVGNGGFSLRSRKLCGLASELKMEWKPFHGFFHEDGFICANNVHLYEGHGCKIAPLELAVRFSQEADLPEGKGIKPFGFHGKGSRYNIQYWKLGKRLKRYMSRRLNKKV